MTPENRRNLLGISKIIITLYMIIAMVIISAATIFGVAYRTFLNGFTVGAVFSVINFYFLSNGVRRMLSGLGRKALRKGYLFFIFRFYLLIVIIYYAVKHPLYINVLFLTLGLLIVQISLFISALKTNLNIRN